VAIVVMLALAGHVQDHEVRVREHPLQLRAGYEDALGSRCRRNRGGLAGREHQRE
jgi:hypothetical protein